jgi:hypothetical protein
MLALYHEPPRATRGPTASSAFAIIVNVGMIARMQPEDGLRPLRDTARHMVHVVTVGRVLHAGIAHTY